MLRKLIEANRDAILSTARARGRKRNEPARPRTETEDGLPAFLDQVGHALGRTSPDEPVHPSDLERSARAHGHELFARGLTSAQVVHEYGDLCQVITGLAMDQRALIGADEFRTLSLCLDDAIAGAVTAHAEHRERAVSDAGVERVGMLADEMRNALDAAMLAFSRIKKGIAAPGGSTGALLERNLFGLQTLIDRTLADVRLDARADLEAGHDVHAPLLGP